MRSIIITNFDLCTGCSICRLACSEEKTGAYNPRLALLDVVMKEEGLIHEPVVCRQCQNAYCQKVCPTEAITRNETTGALIIDEEKCSGCGLCVKYCYVKAIQLSRVAKKALKCDLCGGDPACVNACPTGALEFINNLKTREEVK